MNKPQICNIILQQTALAQNINEMTTMKGSSQRYIVHLVTYAKQFSLVEKSWHIRNMDQWSRRLILPAESAPCTRFTEKSNLFLV